MSNVFNQMNEAFDLFMDESDKTQQEKNQLKLRKLQQWDPYSGMSDIDRFNLEHYPKRFFYEAPDIQPAKFEKPKPQAPGISPGGKGTANTATFDAPRPYLPKGTGYKLSLIHI